MAMRDLIPWGRQDQSPITAMRTDRDWSPLSTFRREVDRLFDDFFRTPTFGASGNGMMSSWPSIEVKEDESHITVTAEVPGMNEKDVELLLDDGMLTIRGEKKGANDDRGYSERWYGRFERRIPLPASVDEEHCRADFREGLLTIRLPKSREAESRRRIPINAETRH
ncbi:MAG TPA: Hsp20/alpha crystallin family protein [Sphingomicrobium sp.]|nr:Hsp20/alpha crystallin family protein [Sphingomicrobium sp.]